MLVIVKPILGAYAPGRQMTDDVRRVRVDDSDSSIYSVPKVSNSWLNESMG